MIGRVIAILILGAILFFPAKMLWNHFTKPKSDTTVEIISDTSNIGAAAKRAASDVQQEAILKITKSSGKEFKTQNKKAQKSRYTFWNSIQDLFGLGPNSDRIHQNNLAATRAKPMAERRAMVQASQEVIHSHPEFEEAITVVEQGSTPAEFVMATVKSPVKHLRYELNSIQQISNGNFRVSWKIKNESGKTILLNNTVKKHLSPATVHIQDFSYQNTMPVQWYIDNTPIANCVIADRIPPFGRVSCNAVVGPQFDTNQVMIGGRVRVKLPGARESVNVYLNV